MKKPVEWTPAMRKLHGDKVRAALANRSGPYSKAAAAKKPAAKTSKRRTRAARKTYTALKTIDLWLLKETLEIDLMAVKDEIKNRL